MARLGLKAFVCVSSIAGACLLLSACFLETYTIRYKLSVAVEVDGREKTGSSVVEVNYIDQAPWYPQWTSNIRGEATYIDLGRDGVLICLLTEDPNRRTGITDPASIPIVYFPSFFRDGLSSDISKGEAELNALDSAKPKTEIPPGSLAMLVWFPSAASPAGGEIINPDEMFATFGQRVKLLKGTVEITDQPVTWGITKKLPWISLLASPESKKKLPPNSGVAYALDDSSFKMGGM
jgi:hypothetical protein